MVSAFKLHSPLDALNANIPRMAMHGKWQKRERKIEVHITERHKVTSAQYMNKYGNAGSRIKYIFSRNNITYIVHNITYIISCSQA